MVYIYILRLESAKYYVGKTNSPWVRLDTHFNGEATSWTSRYRPIEVCEIISNCDDFDEDKYVKIYMARYGIGNVRGGSYSQIILDENTINVLERELRSAENRCFRCGNAGHFARDCGVNIVCYRCGRNNHLVKDCYAETNIYGQIISDGQRIQSRTEECAIL